MFCAKETNFNKLVCEQPNQLLILHYSFLLSIHIIMQTQERMRDLLQGLITPYLNIKVQFDIMNLHLYHKLVIMSIDHGILTLNIIQMPSNILWHPMINIILIILT